MNLLARDLQFENRGNRGNRETRKKHEIFSLFSTNFRDFRDPTIHRKKRARASNRGRAPGLNTLQLLSSLLAGHLARSPAINHMVELQQPSEQAAQHVPAAGDVVVVVMDGCHFPTPPKRVGEIVVPKSTSVEDLRSKMADLCGYKKDAFAARVGKHDLEPEDTRTLEQLEISTAKMIVHLSKPQGSKVNYCDRKC